MLFDQKEKKMYKIHNKINEEECKKEIIFFFCMCGDMNK